MRNGKNLLAIMLALIPFLFTAADCGTHEDDNARLDGGTGGYNGGGGDDGADDTSDDTSVDDTGDDDTLVSLPTVAIVYRENLSRYDEWATLLGYYDYTTVPIDELSLADADLTGIDVFLVDSGTLWYSASDALLIDSVGVPILGMGPGGMHLYDQLGLESGFSNTDGYVYFTQRSITLEASSSAVFTEPYNFGLVDGDIMRILLDGQDLYAIPIDPAPSGVVVLASMDDNPIRSSILIEDAQYMSWGFDLSAGDLNNDGADLLNNCLQYLAGL